MEPGCPHYPWILVLKGIGLPGLRCELIRAGCPQFLPFFGPPLSCRSGLEGDILANYTKSMLGKVKRDSSGVVYFPKHPLGALGHFWKQWLC